MTSRKDVFAALFALVSGAAAFRTTSRIVKLWSDVAPPDQPALFQSEGKQVFASAAKGVPATQTYHAELTIYAHAANLDEGGDVVDLLNELIDAVVSALAPLPGCEKQTLGGLVTDARIDGTIETTEGRMGQQAVAVIPLLIVANH